MPEFTAPQLLALARDVLSNRPKVYKKGGTVEHKGVNITHAELSPQALHGGAVWHPEHEREHFNIGGMPENFIGPSEMYGPPKPKNTSVPVSWHDVPTINPDDLVGKTVFPIMADLTDTNHPFGGIDSSRLDEHIPLRGGPGYPLIPANKKAGVGWAVQGKGRGTLKLSKDADYAVVSAMNPNSHQSNATVARALIGNMAAYARDKRLSPQQIELINSLVREPGEQPELQSLRNFPGFEHPEVGKFADQLSFEARSRIANVLASAKAQEVGAPNVEKILRATRDPNFEGVNRSDALFLLKLNKDIDNTLVNLREAGLPEHESYEHGILGEVVGKFHHPVAAETLWKDWFDQKHKEEKENFDKTGKRGNVRRAFDLALPVGKITPEIAALLPRHPKDIQSPQAGRLALNVINDKWHDSDEPVNKGGVSPADFAQAIKNSDASSTLTQYSAKEIADMVKSGQFKAHKLKDGDVWFGLKHGTNYAEDYGFEHPDLTPNETALTSVVNNEPGAKGIGGAGVMLKAIQNGATALDAYAVPSKKHPDGFLPDYYSHFGFKELHRMPFDPKYVTEQQFNDMKHHWRQNGWDESRGLPSLVIMKWYGDNNDRQKAVRTYLTQGRAGIGHRDDRPDVRSANQFAKRGISPIGGQAEDSRQRDTSGDRGTVRADSVIRPTERLARTLGAVTQLQPHEAQSLGLDPQDVESARQKMTGLARGGVPHTPHPAMRIPGVHIVTSEAGEPFFHG